MAQETASAWGVGENRGVILRQRNCWGVKENTPYRLKCCEDINVVDGVDLCHRQGCVKWDKRSVKHRLCKYSNKSMRLIQILQQSGDYDHKQKIMPTLNFQTFSILSSKLGKLHVNFTVQKRYRPPSCGNSFFVQLESPRSPGRLVNLTCHECIYILYWLIEDFWMAAWLFQHWQCLTDVSSSLGKF